MRLTLCNLKYDSGYQYLDLSPQSLISELTAPAVYSGPCDPLGIRTTNLSLLST
jgi:hypothetical protein